MRSSRLLKVAALLLTATLLAAGCGDDDGDDGANGDGASTTIDGPTIRLRGQDFSGSITLAEVYGQYLRAKGYDVEILTAAGYRTEALAGIENGELDLIIDYIGGDQAALAPDAPASADADAVVEVITPKLAELGATLLDYSPAIDGDALVVRADSEAEKISDVAGLDYVFGAAAECFERPQCYLGLTDPNVYGITFKDTKTLEFGPILGEALKNKEVDMVMWGTTAPELTSGDFKVLEDDKGMLPPQNIAPIVRTEVLDEYADLAADLNALSAMITTDDLIAWNIATDIDKREYDEVARDWLESKGLL
jgi:osmoprotectant transport system substrate-binding protein